MLNNTTTPQKTGNKCGHSPKNPRQFRPPKDHRLSPGFINKGTKLFSNYFQDPRLFPTLNAANGSKRQQRSERREAICQLFGAMLHYFDLSTAIIGVPSADGDMKGLTMAFLAEKAEIGLRRVERAMHDLKAAGMAFVFPICEKLDDTTYKGYAALRTFNIEVFVALGMDEWLGHERRRAVERNKERVDKRQRKKDRKAMAHVKMAMAAQHGPKKPQKPQPAQPESNGRKNRMTPIAEYFFAENKKNLRPDSS